MGDAQFNQQYLNETVKSLQEARRSLNNEDSAQDILNSRRQSTYHMEYTDWANRSIRVMASYTIILVILFIVLSIAHMFGSTITSHLSKLSQAIPSPSG